MVLQSKGMMAANLGFEYDSETELQIRKLRCSRTKQANNLCPQGPRL